MLGNGVNANNLTHDEKKNEMRVCALITNKFFQIESGKQVSNKLPSRQRKARNAVKAQT